MNIYCVHMCTALNLAITERTGDRGGAGRREARNQVCVLGSPWVPKNGSPCWSRQSRLSAERIHKQGWDLKPGTTMAMGCNH